MMKPSHDRIKMNKNWFVNPEFWSLFYDWMFPVESFQRAAEQVDDIMKLTGCTEGRVLDLCCGPGRHSIPLARHGFEVTAVDLQSVLLEKARVYAAAENATIETVEADMREFRRAGAFDLVISMFSSFGYFSNPDHDQAVLENAWHSLKSGGRILLDLRGKEIHAMGHVDTFSSEMPNGDLVIHRTQVNEDWTSVRGSWIYIEGQRAHRFPIRYNLYSGSELRAMLRNTGFDNIEVYGDLGGIPYNDKATRLVVIAEKPQGERHTS